MADLLEYPDRDASKAILVGGQRDMVRYVVALLEEPEGDWASLLHHLGPRTARELLELAETLPDGLKPDLEAVARAPDAMALVNGEHLTNPPTALVENEELAADLRLQAQFCGVDHGVTAVLRDNGLLHPNFMDALAVHLSSLLAKKTNEDVRPDLVSATRMRAALASIGSSARAPGIDLEQAHRYDLLTRQITRSLRLQARHLRQIPRRGGV